MSSPQSLVYPFTPEQIQNLKAGDVVTISGLIFTGRDRLHKHLAETHVSPIDLNNGAIFHCGPIVKQHEDSSWSIIAAGPTTSIREEPYAATIIKEQGLSVIIGKGGMGAKTVTACQEHGCVYLQAVGGAAAIIAQSVKSVKDVYFYTEFGATEAMWALEVEGLNTIVGIDTHGTSLYKEVTANSAEKLAALI